MLCTRAVIYAQDTLTFRVMSYNVENLFDCRHDTLKNDEEFLPRAVRHWNYTRYRHKLDAVAKVIAAVGGSEMPALVGLQEVENDTVLRDLTRRSALREAGYRYVMTSSPDARGVDVALLYRRDLFKLISWESIRIPRTDGKRKFRATRDILHAAGQLLSGDTLDLFVCHFPSRVGGAKESEPFRQLAMAQLKGATDSLFRIRRHPYLLVMGDFNATCDAFQQSDMHHIVAHRRDEGSYKYQGHWELIDHIIVSTLLLDDGGAVRMVPTGGHIFAAPFLLGDDLKYGGKQPLRTYNGVRYEGGFSDHLPVWTEMTVKY
ncbi:MAG: endonuclease/exonuclease/phosphatase family protein [Mediterranea sp.]|nr:endonuclease/exonuclease/phosphatase family protein [Mediterranea sp.]